ncbi:hypothetical protein AGLY_009339 [Aphis glycines]|uniref:Uncharacterized protein n=1 Tax=Aphis glycines TaxID=307491 RepID=A0A6G0TI27_APHGL|nr:hypothetical protein AGLY_009339 [Aphis glycines]
MSYDLCYIVSLSLTHLYVIVSKSNLKSLMKKVGKWVPFCCTLGGRVDLGLGIYDLYFLNNNKYLKSFEDKSLSLRDFILEGKLMENLVLYFQFLVINTKNFMIFQLQNYLQIFAFSTDFFFWSSKIFLPTLQKKIRIKIENFSVFELQPYKKIDSVENWICVKILVFPSFFFVFLDFLKTVRKC